jgi:hypothetical protein
MVIIHLPTGMHPQAVCEQVPFMNEHNWNHHYIGVWHGCVPVEFEIILQSSHHYFRGPPNYNLNILDHLILRYI